jgi:hypothetical protein
MNKKKQEALFSESLLEAACKSKNGINANKYISNLK